MELFTVAHFNELTTFWHVEELPGGAQWSTASREEAEAKAAAYRRFDFPAVVFTVADLRAERVGENLALVVTAEQAATLSES